MLDGRAVIPLAYRGESRFHTTSVENIAGLTNVVLARPTTQILNVGDETALAVGQIARSLAGISASMVGSASLTTAHIHPRLARRHGLCPTAGGREDIIGAYNDGVERKAADGRVVPNDVPCGSIAGHYR